MNPYKITKIPLKLFNWVVLRGRKYEKHYEPVFFSLLLDLLMINALCLICSLGSSKSLSYFTLCKTTSVMFLFKVHLRTRLKPSSLKFQIFFMFSYRFDVLISKWFLKNKNILFWCISKQKAFWTATVNTISNSPLEWPENTVAYHVARVKSILPEVRNYYAKYGSAQRCGNTVYWVGQLSKACCVLLFA